MSRSEVNSLKMASATPGLPDDETAAKKNSFWDTSAQLKGTEFERDKTHIEEQLMKKRLKTQEFQRLHLVKMQE